MNNNSKSFLLDLLSTPSPSGDETEIQHKWLRYTAKYADKVETDMAGNAIAIINPNAKFKVLLAGHCDEIAFMINRIDDNGFLYFQPVGGISHKVAPGMPVEIQGFKRQIPGVIGVNAQHHGGLKKDFEIESLYIDCGAKNKEEISKSVSIGDYVIYRIYPEILLNNKLTGRALDNRTGAFVIAEVIKNLKKRRPKVGVYAVSTVNEETNMGGAYFASSVIKPNMAIACDVTFATDYPGVDRSKHGEIDLDKGPVLAKGAPINYKINNFLEAAANKSKINLQYELTPARTGTDADKMRLTGDGIPVALVSLPIRYMHSPVETASFKDIRDEIKLLTNMICALTGEENLKPLE